MHTLPTLFDAPAISVGELIRIVKDALRVAFPARVRVTGEVSGCKSYPSGHAYFALKDPEGLVKCVWYNVGSMGSRIGMPIPDGTAVEVVGRVSAYAPRSEYQIIVDDVVPTGRGDLYRQFEQLKEKLLQEGLFDESRKRPIPEFVRDVALVTSRGAAALQDFLTTCKRRGAHVSITLVHAPVQGDAAAGPLASAIAYAGRLPVDVVVVTRGGGSIEDLWAFNTEQVARAIARCAKPVISAVGHETDTTIADFVADRRAPTPTAAAEMVTPDREKLLALLDAHDRRLRRCLARSAVEARRRLARAVADLRDAPDTIVGARGQAVDGLATQVLSADPRRRAEHYRHRIAVARQRMNVSVARGFVGAIELVRDLEERRRLAFVKTMVARQNAIDVADARLTALGPSATLDRGYAIVFDERGGVLTDSARTAAGESLDIALARGRLGAKVTDVRRDKRL